MYQEDSQFKSFKINILSNDIGTVLNNYFGPEGVIPKLWKDKYRPTYTIMSRTYSNSNGRF